MRSVRWLALAAGLAACGSPYAEYYEDHSANIAAGIAKPAGPPRLVQSTGDPRRDIRVMFEQGYGLIGTSAFRGEQQAPVHALDQARKVGAELVVVLSQYKSTNPGAPPPLVSGSSTGFGTTNYGGSLEEVYGVETVAFTYGGDTYDQVALYFAPMERRGLGAMFAAQGSEERGRLSGVRVAAIRAGSPSAAAGLKVGDLVQSIDGQKLDDPRTASRLAVAAAGHPAHIELVRGSEPIATTLMIPAGTW